MKTLVSSYAVIFLLLVTVIGCGDDSPDPNLPDQADMSVDTDGGENEADGSEVRYCLRDTDCNDDEYCLREGSGRGECAPGCRDDDSCAVGEVCDTETRICGLAPCETDADCSDETTYCADNGDCLPGCRIDPDNCEPNAENGRFTQCDAASRSCVDIVVCCGADDSCSEVGDGQCDGQALLGAQACAQLPCGEACVTDADCGDDLGRFCNTEDGLCRNGCRIDDPDSCAEGQECDPTSRICEDINCGMDSDCPDNRYCDFRSGQGLCALGCRGDASCEANERCEDNACIQVCNSDDPESCAEGQYCNEFNRCADLCAAHADCGEGQFCDPVTNQCLTGCRDDEGDNGEPNDVRMQATVIPLTMPDASSNNVQFGSLDNRVLCENNADIYRVDVRPGQRVRVTVTYDLANAPGFTLDGVSGSCGAASDCADLIQWTCDDMERVCKAPSQSMSPTGLEAVLEYPALPETNSGRDIVNDNTSYYIQVEPTVDQRFQYRIDVAVADARNSCFPDPRELGIGDDRRVDATEIMVGADYNVTGTACGSDVDWFKIDLSPNDRLEITLRKLQGDDLQLYFMEESQNLDDAGNTNNPNDLLQILRDGDLEQGGTWHIGVKTLGNESNASASYELEVDHTPSDPCAGIDQGDSTETATTLTPSPMADMVYEVGDEINQGTQICNEGARADVDYFCFEASADERLDAWLFTVDATATPGEIAVQFTDIDGNLLGSEALSTLDSQTPDKARYIGTQAITYCARVAGVNGGDGAYRLFINRVSSSGGQCALDIAEEFSRNDRASSAVELQEDPNVAGAYSFGEGYICDLMGSDEDWYTFNVPENRANLCVIARGFRGDRADVDVGVYAAPEANPINCTALGQSTCDNFEDQGMTGAGACIPESNSAQSYCTAYTSRSFSRYDFEMVHITRNETADLSGDFYVRVTHRDTEEGPYTLAVNVSPNTDDCADDRFESNNTPQSAKFLGSGETALCGSWICDNPSADRAEGDWFEMTVPAGQDRTVLIDFPQGEGRLMANATGADREGADGMQMVRSGYIESRFISGGRQCLLIKGGTTSQAVQLQLKANSIASPVSLPNNNRIDYAVRVLPTDLDTDSAGQCNQGREGAPRAACGLWETWAMGLLGPTQPDDCWPVMALP